MITAKVNLFYSNISGMNHEKKSKPIYSYKHFKNEPGIYGELGINEE